MSSTNEAVIRSEPVPPAPDCSHVTLNVSPAASCGTKDADEVDVLVTLAAPVGVQRSPVDICCVIDVSGSMSSDATLKDANGKSETNNLSLLDIVKHAVKTVAHVLGEDDRLAIVSYSSEARLVSPLVSMSASNRKCALEKLEELQPDGMTNLWAGVKLGIESLLAAKNDVRGGGRVASVFVLTDGQPNVEPAVGHVKALERLYASNASLQASLHTFGFGYAVNSKLLLDMARVARGSYIFIPDSSFVGTGFVNCVANTLTTIGQQASLALAPLDGARLIAVGGRPSDSAHGHSVLLGELVADTSKHVVVRLLRGANQSADAPCLQATLTYLAKGIDATGNAVVERAAGGAGVPTKPSAALARHAARGRLVAVLERVVKSCGSSASAKALEEARAEVKALATSIESTRSDDDAAAAALAVDLNGQVSEALSRDDWYSRWGVHYLLSLARSHELEIAANFRDPGLQVYAGALFSKLQAIGDEAFCSLPAPKPAPPPPEVLRLAGGHAAWQAQQSSRPVVSMARYHQSAGPCFHGEARVTMADGSLRRCDQVERGARVLVPSLAGGAPSTALVECVLVTEQPTGVAELCQLSRGLCVTPYHPILVDGEWCFPISRAAPKLVACARVVSFLLADRAPAMLIDNTIVATLAHGVRGNDVIEHPFFATERVVDALRALRGFDSGRVVLRADNALVRDASTGLICGLRQ